MSFEKLPAEIHLNIIRYIDDHDILNNVSYINKYFYDLVKYNIDNLMNNGQLILDHINNLQYIRSIYNDFYYLVIKTPYNSRKDFYQIPPFSERRFHKVIRRWNYTRDYKIGIFPNDRSNELYVVYRNTCYSKKIIVDQNLKCHDYSFLRKYCLALCPHCHNLINATYASVNRHSRKHRLPSEQDGHIERKHFKCSRCKEHHNPLLQFNKRTYDFRGKKYSFLQSYGEYIANYQFLHNEHRQRESKYYMKRHKYCYYSFIYHYKICEECGYLYNHNGTMKCACVLPETSYLKRGCYYIRIR